MTERTMTLSVSVHEALPDILDRLRREGRGHVRVVIPEGCAAFLTAGEFRALRTVADERRLAITVVSSDPLRQQLAGIFKIDVEKVAAPAPRPRPVANDGSLVSTERGTRRYADRESDANREWNDAGKQRRDAAADDGWDTAEKPAPSRRRLPKRVLQVVAGVLVLVLVLGLLAAALTAKATVTLQLPATPVNATASVALVAEGTKAPPADLVFPAVPVTFDVTYTAEVPATGKGSIGITPATGTLQFANASGAPIAIAAGSRVTSDAGIEFAIDTDVTVPPADANRISGKANAPITAVTLGTVGNLGQGALSGQMDNGAYYSNRDGALAGGTDEERQVVADDDIASLAAALKEGLRMSAVAQGSKNLPAGTVLVAEAIAVPDPTVNPSVPVGEEASSVTATTTVQISTLAFTPPTGGPTIEALLAERLSSATVAGMLLATETIKIAAPAVASQSETVIVLDYTASASSMLEPTDDVRNAIAEDMARKPVDEASRSGEIPGDVRATTIKVTGLWSALDRMPVRAGQITIVAKAIPVDE